MSNQIYNLEHHIEDYSKYITINNSMNNNNGDDHFINNSNHIKSLDNNNE